MIRFTDGNGQDIDLTYKGRIYATKETHGFLAYCPKGAMPGCWDEWVVLVPEMAPGRKLHLQYALANLWTASEMATRFLSRCLRP